MKTIESVTFKLKPGTAVDDFMAANEPISDWVKQQPGFISRFLAKGNDELWEDWVLWSNLSEAEQATREFMQVLCSSEFVGMIDESSVTVTHRAVQSSI